MTALALDTGVTTGWATDALGSLEYGEQTFELRRGSSSGMRFLEFRAWLRHLLDACKPRLVVYEQSHFRGGAATEVGVGFTTRVQEVCAELGIEYAAVHTATLKRFATGNGRASKSEMGGAASRLWDLTVEQTIGLSEHMSDALAALAWARAEYGR